MTKGVKPITRLKPRNRPRALTRCGRGRLNKVGISHPPSSRDAEPQTERVRLFTTTLLYSYSLAAAALLVIVVYYEEDRWE